MKNQINMTEGAIFPKLVKFSVPLILSSILQLLFTATDIVVLGRYAGDNSLLLSAPQAPWLICWSISLLGQVWAVA